MPFLSPNQQCQSTEGVLVFSHMSHTMLCDFSISLRFNGHFPGEPGLAGVYWNKGWWRRWWWQLDYWSYKSCKAPVKSSPPTNQHPVFLQAVWLIVINNILLLWYYNYCPLINHMSHTVVVVVHWHTKSRKTSLPGRWTLIVGRESWPRHLSLALSFSVLTAIFQMNLG